MNSIEYPTLTTYFIAYSNEAVSYGVVTSEQVMTTGLPNLWQSNNYEEYVNKLKNEFKIELPQNEII